MTTLQPVEFPNISRTFDGHPVHVTLTTQWRQRMSNTGGTSWPNRKYVTDTHRALMPTCIGTA